MNETQDIVIALQSAGIEENLARAITLLAVYYTRKTANHIEQCIGTLGMDALQGLADREHQRIVDSNPNKK